MICKTHNLNPFFYVIQGKKKLFHALLSFSCEKLLFFFSFFLCFKLRPLSHTFLFLFFQSFHAELHQYKHQIELFNQLTQKLIAVYPTDDTSRIKRMTEAVNLRWVGLFCCFRYVLRTYNEHHCIMKGKKEWVSM